jgi:site-specific DNA-methyltransferase (adenine-specific)
MTATKSRCKKVSAGLDWPRKIPVVTRRPAADATAFNVEAEVDRWLAESNTISILKRMTERYPEGVFDMILAVPPYFLNQRRATASKNLSFDRAWLSLCRKLLKSDGTIWVSADLPVIYSIGFAMQQLEFKLLNDVTWVGPQPVTNPPGRNFSRISETIIWARKSKKSRHYFDYQLMKQMAGGRQMQSVWTIPAPLVANQSARPSELVERIILASTKPNDLILDLSPTVDANRAIASQLGRRLVDVGMDLSR